MEREVSLSSRIRATTSLNLRERLRRSSVEVSNQRLDNSCASSFGYSLHSGSELGSKTPAIATSQNLILDIPFELICELGSGGMAVVHRARSEVTGEHVAIKVPTYTSRDSEREERFLMECELLESLSHENIIKYLGSGEAACFDQNGSHHLFHYLCTELVEGKSLRVLTKEKKSRDSKLPADEARSIVLQTARALNYCIGQDLLHRDIKASNVLVRHDGVVKLCDFGLAKKLPYYFIAHPKRIEYFERDAGITDSRDMIGTPEYLAPELWQGTENCSPSSEIYSLGILLFETMLTQNPLRVMGPVRNAGEAIVKHLKGLDYALFRTRLDKHFPSRMIKIAEASTACNPYHRPNIHEVQSELEKA